jgi:tyrosyl-DNA phosphodiesterase-1
MAGGSLCFNQKNNKPFLSAITHAYVPNQRGREAVPPHIKTYFRYKPDLTVPWFILTSANLSTGAWGNIQKQGTQIMMRNFEAGVLFLPSLVDSNATVRFRIGAHSKVVRTPNSIEVMFPVPCTTPPPKYTSEESSWVWDISHPKPDVMGQRWGED